MTFETGVRVLYRSVRDFPGDGTPLSERYISLQAYMIRRRASSERVAFYLNHVRHFAPSRSVNTINLDHAIALLYLYPRCLSYTFEVCFYPPAVIELKKEVYRVTVRRELHKLQINEVDVELIGIGQGYNSVATVWQQILTDLVLINSGHPIKISRFYIAPELGDALALQEPELVNNASLIPMARTLISLLCDTTKQSLTYNPALDLRKMTCINMSTVAMNDRRLRVIAALGVNLRSLSFASTADCAKAIFDVLGKQCPNLTILKIKPIHFVHHAATLGFEDAIQEVVKRCPNLVELGIPLHFNSKIHHEESHYSTQFFDGPGSRPLYPNLHSLELYVNISTNIVISAGLSIFVNGMVMPMISQECDLLAEPAWTTAKEETKEFSIAAAKVCAGEIMGGRRSALELFGKRRRYRRCGEGRNVDDEMMHRGYKILDVQAVQAMEAEKKLDSIAQALQSWQRYTATGGDQHPFT